MGVWIGLSLAGRLAAQAAAEYHVQPGDVLSIAVDVGMPDYQPPPKVTVGPDGVFSYPVVGDVAAAGRTRQEIAGQIKAALERLYRKVTVTVNVEEYRARNVFVTGEVAKPGAVAVIGPALTLGQAIAEAGGCTEKAAEVTLYRSGAEARLFPVEKLAAQAGEALQPGDILNVTKRQPLMVVGEVAKPGPADLPKEARLTDALALAGGLTPEADAQHAVLINHESQTTVTDLEEVLRNPQGPINLPVADYHTLVVPPRQAIAVIGEVTKPGLHRAGHGMRLTQLLALAEGLTPAAGATATAVTETGEGRSLDLSAALNAPGSEADVAVQDLRTIVVPRERREVIVVGEVQKPGLVAPESWPIPLSGALAIAAGPTTKAELKRVTISRPDGTQEVIDATALVGASLPGADVARLDPILTSGSVVTVPTRYARVTVLGAVREPGSYTFAEGDTAVDAIALAGGLAERGASARKVGLLRRRGEGVEVTEIDLKAGLKGSNDLLAGPLMDRDVVVVPTSRKIKWTEVAAFVFGTATVYGSLRR